jgi:hypothetical protein
MKPSRKYFEVFGGNRVVPESRLEEEVLRQAILGEKWDLPEPERTALEAYPRFRFLLCSSGGVATYQPQWSPDFVVHYEVKRHRDDGFFDLTMKILSAETSEPTGSVELLAALKFQEHPPFQTGWSGAEREHHFIPFWYFTPSRANPKGVTLKLETNVCGALFVPGDVRPAAEWHCSPPHITLLDI